MVAFAGFEVLGRVAQGSTGIVWQARQVELDRLVAIKELSPALLNAPGFLQRFRAEAQMLAGLDDPHVVRIFDYVEEPGRAYLIQEWVDGAPLGTVLEQHGRLSPEQSLGVLRGGLIGLAHAHSRGLVHRDVSPANILLDRAGTSKLLDFGLAAPTQEGLTPGAATSVGTPAFSSPEAVTGAPMTTRSDVYSAAAVLYLLLSGRLPYSGDAAAMLAAHLNAPVPRLDEHGPELADLLARGMAKDPAQRPSDAAAFLAELEDAAARRYGPGWLNRASVAGLVTATTAATGTAALSAGSAGATAGAAPAAAQAVAYGSTATPTTLTGQTTATATRARARILGMPIPAAITIALIAIAAIAGAAIVVTNNNNSTQSVAADADQSTEESAAGTTEPAPTTTALPEVPAFSGTYAVTQVVTAATGNFTFAVGETFQETWQVVPACDSGFCDVTIAAGQVAFAYAAGVWTHQFPPTQDVSCLVNGQPTGVVITLTRVLTLAPTTPYDESSAVPIPALSGTGTDGTAVDCAGNPASYSYTMEVTRTGD